MKSNPQYYQLTPKSDDELEKTLLGNNAQLVIVFLWPTLAPYVSRAVRARSQ